MIPVSFVPGGYLNTSINRTSRRTTISNYLLTYDSAKKFLIDSITLLHVTEASMIPGVSMSTTHWPSSSNSLEARIPWFRVVSRRDPLASLTNYSCNRWSLKIDRTDCPFTVVFPDRTRPITLDPIVGHLNAIREIDHVRDERRRFSNSSRGQAFS